MRAWISSTFLLGIIAALACRTLSAAELADRIVAVSAGSAITWSGALADANCQAFLAGEPPVQLDLNDSGAMEQLRPAIERLADQLILEKVRRRSPLATDPATESETVPTARWDALAATYPSPDELAKEMARYRLNADALRNRLAREQRLMTFVDYSLRPQIRVEASQLTAYYEGEFVPQFRQQQPTAEPPPFEDVRFQIEEILVQRGINQQMGPWLDTLKKEPGLQYRLIGLKKNP